MNIYKAIESNGNSIEKFAKKYNLSYKTDGNLVSLCYDQILTPKSDITNECRGIVLDSETKEVVCYPYYRFGDYNSKTDKLDFENGLFYEKIDGSICTLYYYNKKWNVATKKTPTAYATVDLETTKTIAEYFLEVFGSTKGLDTRFCYITEFKFPSKTHHFIPCNKPTITLTGVRNMNTMEEVSPSHFSNQFDILQGQKFENENQLLDYIYNLDPIVSEGLVYVNKKVVKNGNFQRFKIKSPQFDLISLLSTVPKEEREKEIERNRLNTKRLKNICKYNKHRTFLDYYPYTVFKEEVRKIDASIDTFEVSCKKYEPIPLKDLVKLNLDKDVISYLFLKDKKGITLRDFLISKQ